MLNKKGCAFMAGTKYKRVMIKMSGEALAGKNKFGIDMDVLGNICDQIKIAHDLGTQITIVVGAGNFWRGASGIGMDRTTADHMGMLATTINSLALQDALEARGIEVRTQSAIEMRQIAEPYIRRKAMRHLECGKIVIFACGTGNPFFSTDTAAALRAAEIDAEVMLKATNTDGVYDSDPKNNPDAKLYLEITHNEILSKHLKIMDSTAAALCLDNNLPIIVFNIKDPENIVRVINGEKIGTLVKGED
jgi:uridylate kinase